ncbi:MAG TPA: MFS transporter [Candidatus Binatia bacterium]|nr:MFS transporter [Candidatus Binatia bacterium]
MTADAGATALRPRVLSATLVAYLLSRFCAATAMTMLRAGVAWHVFALTGSAFHLGLIGIVQFLPALGLMLVAGSLADVRDRRRIMQVAQTVSLAGVLVLGTTTARGTITLRVLYAVILVLAAASTFDGPARAALLPTLVPREMFPRAVTIASTNQALAFATGPALGGLLIAAAGVSAVYAAYAVLTCGSLTALAFVRATRPGGPRGAPSLRAIRDGLSFVRRRPVVLGCMVLDMFAVIFGGAAALLPIYAQEILRVGPRGYGLLSSSLEIGAILTSLVLMSRPPVRRTGRTLLVAVAVYGLATIVFGFSRWFPLSVAAYILVGAADQVSVVMRSTTIQLATPDELRGRVSAMNLLFIGASNQLGAAESGFVAALTSAPFAVVSGGVGCLVVLAIVALTNPALRAYRIDRPRA